MPPYPRPPRRELHACGSSFLGANARKNVLAPSSHSRCSPFQCHGSGKSEFCKRIAEQGFDVLDEAFVDMPEFSLHPQTLVMESIWVSKWIERCLEKQKECKDRNGTDQVIYFADRSPFSAVFYAKGPEGKLLEPLIRAQIRQLHELAGITIITVYIKVDPDLLFSRILERLKREPSREKFNESSRQWMDETVAFYDNNRLLWDYTVENDSSIDDLVEKVVAQVRNERPRFQRIASAVTLRPQSPVRIDSPIKG